VEQVVLLLVLERTLEMEQGVLVEVVEQLKLMLVLL
jgi:hypothetical protein